MVDGPDRAGGGDLESWSRICQCPSERGKGVSCLRTDGVQCHDRTVGIRAIRVLHVDKLRQLADGRLRVGAEQGEAFGSATSFEWPGARCRNKPAQRWRQSVTNRQKRTVNPGFTVFEFRDQ